MVSKRWTETKLREINKAAATSTMKELAEQFNCPLSTMVVICKRNLITPLSDKTRWPREVKDFILDNRHLSTKELAEQTGKNEASVRSLLNKVYGPRWRFFMKCNLSREDSE